MARMAVWAPTVLILTFAILAVPAAAQVFSPKSLCEQAATN